ncbi:hypothetical protein [Caloranaerobacter azorensis]|uniref:DUF1540 domain-containing protein n=1 Tax=Caloranaerobacter azorensis DSM 13643 TaxID=1121264 RepID=A0A1M5VT55_9FIRM|nr:hypothetical protein [Caloranaerobacter azorensis]SHH78397.1 hypothetical protein SAMN02745135_02114 [Caloranaerobacter azorensis DSM 13643]
MSRGITKNIKSLQISRLKKCGAITCIHNIDGYCNMEKCEIYERTLRQEH